MNVIEIYKQLLNKVNKNDTNGNVKIPKSQFVSTFNEQKRLWLNNKIKKDESSDYIEDIESLLVIDEELELQNSNSLKSEFNLPSNFFKKVSSYVLASKGECKNSVLANWIVKPKNINVLLQNDEQNPSFEFQETLSIISGNKIVTYKDNFEINSLFLSYYKEPIDIDIEGYIHLDGTPSKNIDIDLDKTNTSVIINMTALEILRNYENVAGMQIALQKQQQNEQLL